MSIEQSKSKSRDLINLQNQYLHSIMDARTASKNPRMSSSSIPYVEAVKKVDYRRSLSQGHSKRMFRYFSLESLFLLVCLTASLLILPLILPPLPPPPCMLLLLPVLIMGLLMVLAFMPANARDVTHTYV
ncbi:hypothetical protein CDL12_14191 [Handroanthus impetiginosus]|uniref:ARGOS-like protein n=1 Tax=Handroanthus impetiginosus TaxID=429701 RepID=A0A2G9H6N9_9LAMI|nr:hypothetical protein CDL12_14191 [Handroanthus impetiginosus]